MTKILGKSVATAKQMSEYLLSVNSSPKFSTNISMLEFCQLFIDVCAKEDVRGDIAFAQACKETGNFKFQGDVKYTQNNFAGLGATGGGVCGCIFESIEEGILAQAQHLKTYATKDDLNEPCVDPRRTNWFVNAKGGTSPDVETLGGTWAVPGYSTSKYNSLESANNAKDSYGYQIVNILNKILEINIKEENNMAYSNSSLVSYIKISPNKTSPRNHIIDTITIHCFVGQVTAQSGCNAKSFVNCNPLTGASCNYVVGYDGSIGLCVEEKDRSWCSSNKANDHRAITIEVASETATPYKVTDNALNALIQLCADICKRNNIKKLVWSTNKNERVNHLNGCNMTVHRDYKNKACPGDYLYERHGYIADEVNKRLGVATNVQTNIVSSTAYTKTQFIKDIQSAIGVTANGVVDVKTLSALPTVSKSKNNKHAVVKPLQKYLNTLGFDCGTADGVAGTKFDNAAKAWAKANGCTSDGEFTAGGKSWKIILGYNTTSSNASTVNANTTTSSTSKYIHDGIDYSLVFDPTYYTNKYSDLKAAFGTNAISLFNHFLDNGMREGRIASVNFNVIAYKNRYIDLQQAFGNDLPSYYRHYIEHGYKEGRSAV